jgi:hypothetical protein
MYNTVLAFDTYNNIHTWKKVSQELYALDDFIEAD